MVMVQRGPLARVLVLGLGWALVLLGMVGLVLPAIQGVLLIALGLYLLSRESRTVRRLLDWIETRHPGLHAALDRANARMRRMRRRLWTDE